MLRSGTRKLPTICCSLITVAAGDAHNPRVSTRGRARLSGGVLDRSAGVHVVENQPHYRPPAADGAPGDEVLDTAAAWAGGCHIDWQIPEADFNSTPRRDMCAIWLWLSDVTPRHAAVRCGAHLRNCCPAVLLSC